MGGVASRIVRAPIPASVALARVPAMDVSRGGLQPFDIETVRPYPFTAAHRQRLFLQKILSRSVGIAMVLDALLCILLGPDFNKPGSAHLFLDLTPHALHVAYLNVLVIWLATFILYGFVGAWNKLQGFRRQCHRLLCIVLMIASVVAKMIVPEQIQLSYAPIVLTVLVEVTYLFIDLTTQVLYRIICEIIPLLLQGIWALLVFFWIAFAKFFHFNIDIHVGRG